MMMATVTKNLNDYVQADQTELEQASAQWESKYDQRHCEFIELEGKYQSLLNEHSSDSAQLYVVKSEVAELEQRNRQLTEHAQRVARNRDLLEASFEVERANWEKASQEMKVRVCDVESPA